MPSVTDEIDPPVACPSCGFAHLYDDDAGSARKAWVTKQHAPDRFTGKSIVSLTRTGYFHQGDLIIDRDGDTLMFWDGVWVSDPWLNGRTKPCNFVDSMIREVDGAEGNDLNDHLSSGGGMDALITTKLCDGLAETYESKTNIQIETRCE